MCLLDLGLTGYVAIVFAEAVQDVPRRPQVLQEAVQGHGGAGGQRPHVSVVVPLFGDFTSLPLV